MGLPFSQATRPKRLLFLGLNASGKTSVLHRMMGEVKTTSPTIGCNVEMVTRENFSVIMCDVGGKDWFRPLWRHYYKGCDGLVFVVDSNDRDRIDESRKELEIILADDELRSVPVLIFANKQDLPEALTVEEVSEALHLSSGTRRLCHVQPSSALRGEGLEEGLTWVTCVFETGFSGPPLVVTVTVTVVQEGGTQQVSFTNLAGAELAVLSCREAAQQTFGEVQREIAERAEVELGRVQFVLAGGEVLSGKDTTPVSDVLDTPSSFCRSGCVVA